jgi:DNA-binding FadR family transcriptional regulator
MTEDSTQRVRPRLRGPRTTDLVADELRRTVVQGEAGEYLPPERVLAEQYEVSRPILREAIRVLESEGLVEVRRGIKGGARILEPSMTELARGFAVHLQRQHLTVGDLLLARETLETAAVRLASSRGAACKPSLQARLDAEAATIITGDRHDIAESLAGFHEFLFALSGSESLGALGAMLRSVVNQYTESGIDQIPPDALPALSAEFHEVHCAIADAIVDGDADRAAQACSDHLRFGHRGRSRQLIDVFAPPAPQATRTPEARRSRQTPAPMASGER